MKSIKRALPYITVGSMPLLALAQGASDLGGLINTIGELLNDVVPILLLLATVVFIWGVIMFITAGADEEKRGNARNLMIYGVIALAVILAVWGLARILIATFVGTSGGQPTDIGEF